MYAIAITLFVFFLVWAAIATRPFPASSTSKNADPRLARLAAREQRLRRETVATRRLVNRRWAAYNRALAQRNLQIAAAKRAAAAPPVVRIVAAPAATSTRTS
jgi:hypothetical protein